MAHHSNTSTRLIFKERTVICGRGGGNHLVRFFIVFLADPGHVRLKYEHSLLFFTKLEQMPLCIVAPFCDVFSFLDITALPLERCTLCYSVIVFLTDLSCIRRPRILTVSKFFIVYV